MRGNDTIVGEINRRVPPMPALKVSGTASAGELAQAKLALTERVRELRAELSGVPAAFERIRSRRARPGCCRCWSDTGRARGDPL